MAISTNFGHDIGNKMGHNLLLYQMYPILIPCYDHIDLPLYLILPHV